MTSHSVVSATSSTSATNSPPKREWIQRWIHKLSQNLQTEENKKMIHVFVIDPIINHILERILPYIIVMCVLFMVLTGMIMLTLFIIFTRLPAAFGAVTK